jgi:hypothetical protein
MPKNVPPQYKDKFERCMNDIMAKGKDKSSAIAICYSAIVEKASAAQIAETFNVTPDIVAYLETLSEKSANENFGGDGSGNFGHAGRPGEIGGSAAGSAGTKNDDEADPIQKSRRGGGGEWRDKWEIEKRHQKILRYGEDKDAADLRDDVEFKKMTADFARRWNDYKRKYGRSPNKVSFAELASDDSQAEPFTATERIAFEPFAAAHFKKPFRIVPFGKYYRGERVLDVTPERAREIVNNFNAGLPRYGVNVNVEHGADPNQPGMIGRIKKLTLGADGIYADAIDLTKAGEKLADEERYRAVSPEIIWSLNGGAKYQDPTTGAWHDNVLSGLALTTTPYFGESVAVFSAKAEKKEMDEEEKAKMMAQMDDAAGDKPAPPETLDDDEDEEEKKNKKDTPAQGDDMSVKPTPKGGEQTMAEEFKVTPEEFNDLKAKAEKFAALEAQLSESEKKRAKLAEDFAAERQLRRNAEFVEAAEKFNALPAQPVELGGKLLALYDADPTEKKDLYSYFETLLQTADKALAQSDLFKTVGTGRTTDSNAHPFLARVEAIRQEKFGTQPYAEGFSAAFKIAERAEPELAKQYANEH